MLRRVLLTGSFGIFLAIGLLGPSAAKPPLGPRGWAPGELPFAPSSAGTTGLLAAAYLLGLAAVALALLRPPTRSWSWRGTLLLAAGALLTGPFGSADHTNYAAYGRIAAQGGDPYLVPPEDWAAGLDPVTSAVEPPWTETVSVYGPFATVLHLLSSVLGGDSMRQTVGLAGAHRAGVVGRAVGAAAHGGRPGAGRHPVDREPARVRHRGARRPPRRHRGGAGARCPGPGGAQPARRRRPDRARREHEDHLRSRRSGRAARVVRA